MKKILSLFLIAILSILLVGCDKDSNTSAAADNQSWPNKTITIIVPFNGGGDTDFHARNLASHLEKELGVTPRELIRCPAWMQCSGTREPSATPR